MEHVAFILFDGFTVLDALGPAEILAALPEHFSLDYYSVNGGSVCGSTGMLLDTLPLDMLGPCDVLIVPGGYGTRALVDNRAFLQQLRTIAEQARWVLGICTGVALLARSGLLEGRHATSNKRAWEWVTSQGLRVEWIRRARWVTDDRFYTSSGVSAGMDMCLGFVADRLGMGQARAIADVLEYRWNPDPADDPFA